MLYTNIELQKQVIDNGNYTLTAFSLGERGRGRRELRLPSGIREDTITKGLHKDLTIGTTKSGRPRINHGRDNSLYLAISSEGGYTRRGNGVIFLPINAASRISVMAVGNGADGDAGRIGTWDCALLKVPADETIPIRVMVAGGGADRIYMIHEGNVYEGTMREITDLCDHMDLNVPFPHSVDKYGDTVSDLDFWTNADKVREAKTYSSRQEMVADILKEYPKALPYLDTSGCEKEVAEVLLDKALSAEYDFERVQNLSKLSGMEDIVLSDSGMREKYVQMAYSVYEETGGYKEKKFPFYEKSMMSFTPEEVDALVFDNHRKIHSLGFTKWLWENTGQKFPMELQKYILEIADIKSIDNYSLRASMCQDYITALPNADRAEQMDIIGYEPLRELLAEQAPHILSSILEKMDRPPILQMLKKTPELMACVGNLSIDEEMSIASENMEAYLYAKQIPDEEYARIIHEDIANIRYVPAEKQTPEMQVEVARDEDNYKGNFVVYWRDEGAWEPDKHGIDFIAHPTGEVLKWVAENHPKDLSRMRDLDRLTRESAVVAIKGAGHTIHKTIVQKLAPEDFPGLIRAGIKFVRTEDLPETAETVSALYETGQQYESFAIAKKIAGNGRIQDLNKDIAAEMVSRRMIDINDVPRDLQIRAVLDSPEMIYEISDPQRINRDFLEKLHETDKDILDDICRKAPFSWEWEGGRDLSLFVEALGWHWREKLAEMDYRTVKRFTKDYDSSEKVRPYGGDLAKAMAVSMQKSDVLGITYDEFLKRYPRDLQETVASSLDKIQDEKERDSISAYVRSMRFERQTPWEISGYHRETGATGQANTYVIARDGNTIPHDHFIYYNQNHRFHSGPETAEGTRLWHNIPADAVVMDFSKSHTKDSIHVEFQYVQPDLLTRAQCEKIDDICGELKLRYERDDIATKECDEKIWNTVSTKLRLAPSLDERMNAARQNMPLGHEEQTQTHRHDPER